jgi:hypothetical protein
MPLPNSANPRSHAGEAQEGVQRPWWTSDASIWSVIAAQGSEEEGSQDYG